MDAAESQEIRQARQRASVKWLLSKAFNNRIPDNLKEPFYRDHENQERLKPQIIVEMGNATLYCQTLSNLYSDPNYQSLNHWSILQTLARKGVPVPECGDMPLTETVLIQTNPLRINAHMSVIESLMILYAKEITSGNRILNAIRRISGSNNQAPQTVQTFEQSLLAWISHACAALKKRIAKDVEAGVNDENGARLQTPDIPPVRDFQDLCDGICLALLISYYCPKVVPWQNVRINYLPAVEDSIHNILLVSNFSQKHLPYSVFHMTPEDITYMRGSMKLNLVLLLADLFNLFEIHPAKCVCYPGMDAPEEIAKRKFGANEHGICHRRGLTMQPVTPIPDLRSELDSASSSPTNRPPFQVSHSASTSGTTYSCTTPTDFQMIETKSSSETNHSEGFVVHKSRGITTLSTMNSPHQQQEPLVPARLRQSKEKTNNETKADERGDNVAAGRPSNWEQNRRPSYAGRRSRRNSSSEDSQLTIENFGGSQDQLNTIGRYERERDRDRERKLSSASVEPAVAIRSSIADARGTLQIGYETDSGSEKQDHETEKYLMQRQPSVDNVSLQSASIAQLHNNKANTGSPIPSTHTQKQHSINKDYADDTFSEAKVAVAAAATAHDYDSNSTLKAGKTTNAAWQNNHSDSYEDDTRSLDNATKLSSIRMKLEEKRRRIEQDKRKIEMALLRHQEKAAYGVGGAATNSEQADRSGPSSLGDRQPQQLMQDDIESCSEMLKWETLSNDSNRTPDIDPVDLDKYQQSIAIMNMNLQDIQQDIQRLATQQSQIHAQQLQAQQLMQAQQIANMLHQQQNYGSQQHLADNFQQQRSMQIQQNFGSTPHLPHAFNAPVNAYNSRPPSRDPYQQQMHPMPMQYVNEHGQYMSPQQQPPPPMMQQPQYMQSPPNMYTDNVGPYNNHGYGGPPYMQAHHGQPPPPQPQYMSRQPAGYDDYSLPHHARDMNSPQPNHLFMHDVSNQPPPQRRTWSQSAYEHQQPVPMDVNSWQAQKRATIADASSFNTWKKNASAQQQGFVLHQNDGGGEYQHLFQVHSSPQHVQASAESAGGAIQRQHSMSNIHDNRTPNMILKGTAGPSTQQAPSDDMMAPQSICFIGDEEDVEEIERNIIESMQSTRISDYAHQQQQQHQQQQHQMYGGRGSSSEDYDNDMLAHKLNITSGNLTYRIPSPSRPSLHSNSFQNPREDATSEKGFYISFDDTQPKRPKPPLRAKRSPKKEKSGDNVDHQSTKRESYSHLHHRSEDDDAYNGISMETKHQNTNGNSGINKGTYNKYTDSPIQIRQLATVAAANNSTNNYERRHLEDVTNQQQQQQQPAGHSPSAAQRQQSHNNATEPKALVIGNDVNTLDPESVDEMERRKEKIMLLSLQRRQQQEEAKARKEIELSQKREREREKEEERARKKEEQMARRAAILEQHRLKKAIEEAEREGKTLDRADLKQQSHTPAPRLRQQRNTRPRPKTIHVDDGSVDLSEASSISSRDRKGSSTNLTGYGQLSSNSLRRDFYRGSQDSLTVKESPDEYPSTSSTPIGRRGSYKTSREPTAERGRSRISVAKGSTLNFRGRKSNSLMNLCDTDSGLGRATPPRRAPSPGMAATGRHMPSPSGPGSLPPGLISKRRGFDDGSSDISSMMEYSGPKLYKQPAAKSNRGIILNAVEYCVFPGAVNREAKQKVLEKIARSEAKHFLVLFRDAGCQFRALYSYMPETDQVSKLYGTGPSQVDEVMFDKFFKYNSGGKCFSQVHTKHLTVTIDAFTIHNSLWQGKKVHLPSKKDMALVI